MDRINGPGHVNNRFVAEDAATLRPPTEITPEWMNGVQEELVAVITAAGIALSSANSAQLLAALRSAGVFQTASQFDNSTKAATTAYVNPAFTSKLQPITASVAGNALTIGLNPTMLDFRSSLLTSGAVNTRTLPAPASITVPSGATLGTVGGQQARLVLLAIDNAGTVELAVANLAGGVNLDETTLISTTAISAVATNASGIYSTSARANVPFRVVGFIDITETVAGTWATAPSTIQGQGGQALAAMQSLGYSQTWQNVSASRAIGTTYYNTTGRPIFISIAITVGSANANRLVVNGTIVTNTSQITGAAWDFLSIVPPGGSYVLQTTTGTGTIESWNELR